MATTSTQLDRQRIKELTEREEKRLNERTQASQAMYDRAEKEISDDEFRESYIVSSDPEHHVERIREIEQIGATVVCLQNGSGSAPEQALRVYEKSVLPALKD